MYPHGDSRAPLRHRAPYQRRARIRVALLVVAAAFGWTALALTARTHGFFDLSVYHGALRSWVREGGSLYDYSVPGSVFGFTYPPFAGLAMVALAYLPWPATVILACGVTTACTVAVAYLLVGPIALRRGWDRWFAVALAVVVAPALEPFLETLLFGQINLVLVLLVTADVALLLARGNRLAGVGIGLAAAIKLTPAVFILYLLVTRRWRAAAIATGTAVAATLVAVALAPNASRVYWTSALWHTSRVGDLDFIANQSLLGALARWNPANPNRPLEMIAVLVVVVVWFVKVRATAVTGDWLTGLALTGVLGCLISPVTWIHHLVWLAPALILVTEAAVRRTRRWWAVCVLVLAAGVLCTRIGWHFQNDYSNPLTWFASNGYLWLTLTLLAVLPAAQDPVDGGVDGGAGGAGGAGDSGGAEKAATVRFA